MIIEVISLIHIFVFLSYMESYDARIISSIKSFVIFVENETL